MRTLFQSVISTPIGMAELGIFEDKLAWISIGENYPVERHLVRLPAGVDLSKESHPLVREIKRELDEYFERKRKSFTIPLTFLYGTDNQKRIWNALAEIPYGVTIRYAELGRKTGCASPRAVGTIVGQNPLPLFLPCHRVVRSDGRIGQFSCGEGEPTKRFLLELEQSAAVR